MFATIIATNMRPTILKHIVLYFIISILQNYITEVLTLFKYNNLSKFQFGIFFLHYTVINYYYF